MNGSVNNPRNRFIALKVACCEPVAVSPETCDSPAGVSVANATGMPPLELKKLVSRIADIALVGVKAWRRPEVERKIEKGVRRIVAQRGDEAAGATDDTGSVKAAAVTAAAVRISIAS